jgi:thiamine kinase-like enzyme
MMNQSEAIERLAGLPIWPAQPIFAAIEGGRTNQNFKVTAGDARFFARLGVDLPHHGITRSNELACARLAAYIGVAPAIIHAGSGVLVTAFIDGRTLVQGEPTTDDEIRRIAEAMRRLESAPIDTITSHFDPCEVSRTYLRQLPGDALSRQRKDLAAAILDAAPKLRRDRLVHGDLIPENFIVTADGVMIVDWEYAGRGDPAVDIAGIAVNFGLSREQTRRLITLFGDIDPEVVAALEPVLALREALWGEAQLHAVGLRGDLTRYIRLCWDRLEQTPI